jgi:predicted membrane protein
MLTASPSITLPTSVSAIFSSARHAGSLFATAELFLKAAFGELMVDLRRSVLPRSPMVIVAESLCASVEVLLPPGVTMVDHTQCVFSSHKLSQESCHEGPVIHLEGWSVCSDVKFISERS